MLRTFGNTKLSARNVRRLAWFLVGASAVLLGIGLALQVVTDSPLYGVPRLIVFLEAAYVIVFGIVGALILSRHPRHPIGWIWILFFSLAGLDHFAWGYAYYGSIAYPGSLPGVEAMIIWMYLQVRATLGLLLMTLLLLLFPDGRPLSRRWSMLAWIALGVVSVATLVSVVAPNPFGYFPFPTDLLAVGKPSQAVMDSLFRISSMAARLCVLLAAFSLFIRLSRARGVERQQLKWFVYAAAFFPAGVFVIFLGQSRQAISVNWVSLLGIGLTSICFGGMSVASAIAIFRYRLWDIDLIIRRTLVYGALTGTLVLIYFAAVTLLQAVFSTISNQQSPLAIVLSTLAIAALFRPLLRRIQNDIDRRFYRRRYNAEQVLAAFSARLRDEVDLERLTVEMLAVIEETVQPEHLTIWLPAPRKNPPSSR